jgi:hypothetical protein
MEPAADAKVAETRQKDKTMFPKKIIIALVGVGLIFTSTVFAEDALQPTGPKPQQHDERPVVTMGLWATPVVAGGPTALPVELPRAPQSAGKNLWRASMLAVAAANVMDAHSSWGKRELNLNLAEKNGSFGPQGVLLKVAIVGGIFGVESLILRHHSSAKFHRILALVNFGSASVTGATAIQNLSVPRR